MRKSLPKAAMAALALTLPATQPAEADPTLGIGLSFVFGGSNSSRNQTGLAIRLFSDDAADHFAASLGINYMFGTGALSPTAGIAYLGSNTFVGLDMGLGLDGSGANFGLSGGVTDTYLAPTAPVGGGGGGGGGDSSVGGGGDGNDLIDA